VSGAVDEQLLGSALEPAALRTSAVLAAAVARLRALTPERRWHLTGSGGALFCVARDANDARSAAACAHAQGFVARACRALTG
jgi:4-diphosphocytidyl-2C-methyl-D-erythritol kinase